MHEVWVGVLIYGPCRREWPTSTGSSFNCKKLWSINPGVGSSCYLGGPKIATVISRCNRFPVAIFSSKNWLIESETWWLRNDPFLHFRGLKNDLRVYSCGVRPQNEGFTSQHVFFVEQPDTWRMGSHDLYLSGDRITSIYWHFNEGNGHLEREKASRSWGPKTITMVINHLQVMGWSSK